MQTCKIGGFAKIVNSYKPFTAVGKFSILDHLYSTYAKFSRKVPTRRCVYQGVRTVSSSENCVSTE